MVSKITPKWLLIPFTRKYTWCRNGIRSLKYFLLFRVGYPFIFMLPFSCFKLKIKLRCFLTFLMCNMVQSFIFNGLKIYKQGSHWPASHLTADMWHRWASTVLLQQCFLLFLPSWGFFPYLGKAFFLVSIECRMWARPVNGQLQKDW